MRLIKLALISFVFLFLIVTLMTLLLPSANNISRAIDIHAPYSAVYNSIYQLKQWECWYPGDKNRIKISGKTANKGAAITINNSAIQFISSTPGSISAFWKYGNNETITGSFTFIPSADSSITTLQWQFVQKVNWYPWEKLALIAGNKTIGPFLEQGLENINKCVISNNQ